jgi:pimeloyl-ACP methyl ester carboxylesterase
LVRLAQQIGTPDAIIGHSYGGKVSLFFSALMSLEQCWILDAIPHPQSDASRHDLRHIFQQLRTSGAPFTDRDNMVDTLKSKGLSSGLIQWMTTNLKRTDVGYDWAFNLANATDMIEDYFEWDAMPLVQGTERPIHFVRADQNLHWSHDIIDDIQACAPLVQIHTLRNAGHWVHVDNPTGLLDLMTPYFKA